MNYKLFILTSLLLFVYPVLPLYSEEIHDAIRNGEIDAAKILITKNPRKINAINSDGHTPLSLAMSRKNYELTIWLLKNGADHTKFIKIDQPLNPDAGYTLSDTTLPLLVAVFYGWNDAVKYMINKKNSTKKELYLAFEYAIECDRLSTVILLLSNVLNPKIITM